MHLTSYGRMHNLPNGDMMVMYTDQSKVPYWEDPSTANRNALRAFLTPETTRWQYTHGVPDVTFVSPDGMSLDNFYLARAGADEVQLDLFGDYKSNVALYPAFQDYFRATPCFATTPSVRRPICSRYRPTSSSCQT